MPKVLSKREILVACAAKYKGLLSPEQLLDVITVGSRIMRQGDGLGWSEVYEILGIPIMKKPEDCTIEELIAEVHYWEAPEAVQLYSLQNGGVCLSTNEGACCVEKPTFKEALIAYGYEIHNRFRPWTAMAAEEDTGKKPRVDWSRG